MSKKIAIVHDYLREFGGAERVVEALHELFPDAPVYCSFKDDAVLGIHAKRMQDWDIRQTWISKLPWYKKLFSPYRIFAPAAFSHLDLSEFDLVISSSNAYYAKAVKVPNGKHICYCHTPPRALYGYSTMTHWQQHTFTRIVGTVLNHFLRIIDFNLAQKVDHFVANSQETKRRIRKFYRRDATVIYPPIHIPSQLELDKAREKKISNAPYYISVGRLAVSKHVDLSISVCRTLQRQLVVIGAGKNSDYLRSIAGPTVTFLGEVDDETLQAYYANARALLFPAEDEDFGMVPVEAMGYGIPVIAHASGGPRETVIPGKTGVLFSDLSESGMRQAIENFEVLEHKKQFSKEKIRKFAQKFSKKRFFEEISAFIADQSL